MLKYALLGAAMAITAPALAQNAPATPQDSAVTGQAAPATQAAPAADAAAPDAAAADPAPASAPAETAATAQPAGADQVASVIGQQFGTYDKDADGKLNEVEFAAWMVALKTQTDPATDANAPATKSWNKAAFAQADKDKSKSLDKTELASFLSPSSKS